MYVCIAQGSRCTGFSHLISIKKLNLTYKKVGMDNHGSRNGKYIHTLIQIDGEAYNAHTSINLMKFFAVSVSFADARTHTHTLSCIHFCSS